MFLKRLPGLAFKYKWISITLICTGFIFCSALFWGFICLNWEPWGHVRDMCADYGQRKILGDLCTTLCSAKTGVDSVSCVRSQRAGGTYGSRSVFTAMLRAGDGTNVVFKSFNLKRPINHSILNWVHNNRGKNLAFNTSPISVAVYRNTRLNRTDPLLNDNDYLLSRFYVDREIFPRLVGTCGNFYVTEHLHSALDGKMVDDSATLEEWAKRVHLAVELLQLIEQIDQENLLMCHVTPIQFGLTASGKMKIMDLDLTLPKDMVDSITASGRKCSSDSDCGFYDCKSTCDLSSGTCGSPVANTNLQIVCEKIFVGWSFPGRLLVPGLLMSVHTPMALTSLLRQCAHNIHSQEIAAHIATRLSDTLAEIDITLEQHRLI